MYKKSIIVGIVIISIIIVALYMTNRKNPTFNDEMTILTTSEIRDNCTQLDYQQITAGVFNILRSDAKDEDPVMNLFNRTNIHQMGYIERNGDGDIINADVMEIGTVFEENEYHVLPIKNHDLSFVTVMLDTDLVLNVFYNNTQVKHTEYHYQFNGPKVWCSFFVETSIVDFDSIKIDI